MARERRTTSGRFFDPTVPILLITLLVHVVRQDVVDIAVFAGVVALIAVDHARPVPVVDVRWPAVPWWGVAACCVTIGAVGVLPIGSTPVRIMLVAIGLLAAVAVLTAPRGAPGAGPDVAARWWAWPAVLVLLALIELVSFLLQPDPQTGSYANPTLSTLLDPVLAEPAARLVALTLWSASGWWLLRTIRRPGDRR
ncbi:hypothetical protein [Cumulibacter manganitolerans]|uniref:hypothetical protein n=1 Tax=Cumulibacter manganitolerans TaxID=1884992 RepID=UPI001295EFC3|nr:hypothetical protein [Cumulibacter manganitolerans]